MAIAVKIISLPSAIERLRARGPQILEAITGKMNELMIRLQAKVVGESIPLFFKTDQHIGASVRVTPAHVEGTAIVGYVDAGGTPETIKVTLKSGAEVDYAVVQEFGVDHGWEIAPFNKKALAFVWNGKQAIFRRVYHPPLEARPFMRSELQNFESQIIEELGKSFTDALNA